MRIFLKILAAPFVAILTLSVGLLAFLQSLASSILGLLSLVCGLCGLFAWCIQGDMTTGIQVLLLAFVISPFGLPAAAGWLIERLADLNGSLREFMVS